MEVDPIDIASRIRYFSPIIIEERAELDKLRYFMLTVLVVASADPSILVILDKSHSFLASQRRPMLTQMPELCDVKQAIESAVGHASRL